MSIEMGTGLRLACFDAGGIRALSQARMVEALMHRIQYDLYPDDPEKVVLPCEVFDMMGGSDTGGLLAIMYGKLRMSATEALEELHTICSQVYLEELSAEKRSDRLRNYLEEILSQRRLPKDLKLEHDARMTEEGCPCFVLAVHKRNATTKATLRSYRSRSQTASNITVIDAVLATCATQPLFPSITVGPVVRRQEYVGATMGASNPVRELVSEAHQHFKSDSYVSTILSMGSGNSGIISLPNIGDGKEGSELMRSVLEDCERVYQEARSQYGPLGILFRLSVEHGLQGDVDEKESPLEMILTHTESYLLQDEISERMDHCVESIRLRQGRATLDQLKHSGVVSKVYKALPRVATFFVMRQEPWNRMTELLLGNQTMMEQRVSILSGLGGSGKTTLVTRFAKEDEAQFRFVFFIDGSSKESIQADILGYVRASDYAYSQSAFNDAVKFLYDKKNLPWLLIYDNVDDVTLDILSLMPDCSHGSIIVTTRNRSLGRLASPPRLHIELDIMSEAEAVDTILQSAGLSASEYAQDSALKIANELGCLPIALTQAGSYIRETSCSLEEYLLRLRGHKAELLNMPAQDRQHRSTYAAFEMSYQRLSSPAQQFLHIIACLSFANFPVSIVSFGAKSTFREDYFELSTNESAFEQAVQLLTAIFCPDGQWSDIAFDQTLTLLNSYSLVSITPAPLSRLLRIHPLLREFIASKMSPEQKSSYQSAAARLIACSAMESQIDFLLTTHVVALPIKYSNGPISMTDCAGCAYVFNSVDRYKEAMPIWEDIHQDAIKRYGATSLEAATAKLWLADCFVDDWGKMEELEKEVVRIREEILGSKHRRTNQAKMNLSNTYSEQERYEESLTLRQQVIDTLSQDYGPLDKDVLEAMYDQADTFRDQGKNAEAQKLLQVILERRKQLKGEEDNDIIVAMNDLALNYNEQKMYSEALPIQEHVLKYRRQNLGDEHPYTALAMNNLAWTYVDLGRFSEARELVIEAEPIRRNFGVEHEDYENTAGLIVRCDEELAGEHAGEELCSYWEGIVEEWKGRLGDEGIYTLTAMNDLALAYYEQGRYSDALPIQEYVLKHRRQKLGDKHSHTALAMYNLGWTYLALGRVFEARQLAVEAEGIKGGLETDDEEYKETATLLSECDKALAKQRSNENPP